MRHLHLYVEGITDRELVLEVIQRWARGHSHPEFGLENESMETFEKSGQPTTQTYLLDSAALRIAITLIGGYSKVKFVAPEIQRQNDAGQTVLMLLDADADPAARRAQIERERDDLGLTFDLFLFPDNAMPGCIETLMRHLVHPNHKSAVACFDRFLCCLRHTPYPDPKHPAGYKTEHEKTRFYLYAHSLRLSGAQKKRAASYGGTMFFDSTEFWSLSADAIKPLKDFLDTHLGP